MRCVGKGRVLTALKQKLCRVLCWSRRSQMHALLSTSNLVLMLVRLTNGQKHAYCPSELHVRALMEKIFSPVRTTSSCGAPLWLVKPLTFAQPPFP